MSKTRIFAKSDPIFKMIFGDPENKTALIGLLREIIDIPEEEYAHIEIIDPNLRVNKSYGKSGILDIKLTTKSGQRINVEIQIRKASDLKQRILFYASKMVAEQLTEGEKYDKIRKVISIMICTDHNLIEDSKEYHNKYFLYDKNTNSTFTDLLEIDILEFKKVPEKDKSNLATWLRFLNTDDREELDKMAVRNEAFKSAVCKYMELTYDELMMDKAKLRTFNGGLRATLEMLKRQFPYMSIILVSAIQRNYNPTNPDSKTYSTMEKKADAMKRMAGRYSCIFADALREIGICDLYENAKKDGTTRFLGDGLHANDTGKTVMRNYLNKVIQSRYFDMR